MTKEEFIRSATAFLSSSDVYFFIIKLHTVVAKSLGCDGLPLPVRILERNEAS